MIGRRRMLAALAALGSGCIASARAGERAYPQRPITLWVPWSAGGATDITLRLLAELAGQRLKQAIVVENRAGAGGTLAMPILQQAAPDGYTIAQLPHPVLRAPYVRRVAWDPLRDTTPILQVSGVTFGLLVPVASALRSVDDLFAFARARPGELTIATNGVGTTPHNAMDELFARRHLDYAHVPYKGAAEQMVALSAGHVMAGVCANGFAPFVDGGQLRLLAVFGPTRSARWPKVPTMRELGLDIVATSPYGLVGPRGLAPDVLRTLHDAFKEALFDPLHVAELAKFDQDVAYLGSADYARSLRDASAAEQRAVERQGLTLSAS